jgi:hypothetical protein
MEPSLIVYKNLLVAKSVPFYKDILFLTKSILLGIGVQAAQTQSYRSFSSERPPNEATEWLGLHMPDRPIV